LGSVVFFIVVAQLCFICILLDICGQLTKCCESWAYSKRPWELGLTRSSTLWRILKVFSCHWENVRTGQILLVHLFSLKHNRWEQNSNCILLQYNYTHFAQSMLVWSRSLVFGLWYAIFSQYLAFCTVHIRLVMYLLLAPFYVLWRVRKSKCTDEKDNLIFLIYTEIQSGAIAKSYMRKGFLIYEEMRKYFPVNKEAVSHIWRCNCSILNFLIYEENLIFFFISVLAVTTDVRK
jgi:hypothetical protein